MRIILESDVIGGLHARSWRSIPRHPLVTHLPRFLSLRSFVFIDVNSLLWPWIKSVVWKTIALGRL
jgi:hypothetical protein